MSPSENGSDDSPGIDSYGLVRPCTGHRVSGDAVFIKVEADGVLLCLIDALGHGVEAHAVSKAAVTYLEHHASSDIEATIKGLHKALQGSRGAAVGLCYLKRNGNVRYVGIGNTVVRKLGKDDVRLVSRDGIVGESLRTPRVEAMKLATNEVLLMHTDGVKSHFDQTEYPQILGDSARRIATSVIKRFGKPHDDAGCLAARYTR